MGLLVQVVEVAVGELGAVGGHLHGEARGDAVGPLAVDQSVVLEVPRSEDGGDLGRHTHVRNRTQCWGGDEERRILCLVGFMCFLLRGIGVGGVKS